MTKIEWAETVKMKPIIFSTAMVKAILENRKRHTRRVVKPQPPDSAPRTIDCHWLEDGYGFFDEERDYKCPYGTPGDILWVRETWLENAPSGVSKYFYKAEAPEEVILQAKAFGYKWRPPIFMPKEAARLFLKVLSVRVERLQEITSIDALAEGTSEPYACRSQSGYDFEMRVQFKELWDSIYEKRGDGWSTNPYVWVIEFERKEK